jgi:small subunit ribosomal protein S17
MSKKSRSIGIDAQPPEKTCEDPNCPWCGSLSVRGRIFEGKVVSTKMNRSVVIRKDYQHLVRKYDRYESRKGLISAHQPQCIDLKVGDSVRAMECRPLSKSKSFVVIEKVPEKH